jgi:hypothetical protein
MVDPELLPPNQASTPLSTSRTKAVDYEEDACTLPKSTPYTHVGHQAAFDSSTCASTQDNSNLNGSALYAVNAHVLCSPSTMRPPREVLNVRHRYQAHNNTASSPTTSTSDTFSPFAGPLDPHSPYMTMPLTPSSSVNSEESVWRGASSQQSPPNPPDLRRMSVQNIINNDFSEHGLGRRYPIADNSTTTYGYDLGLPDLDAPNNDDFSAITIFSPQATRMELDGDTNYADADPRSQDMAFESGGYYAKPVPIRISKSLGALPAILMENPMNLLYFHHFLNHTARILVPHDCERNPFRQILPQSKYFVQLFIQPQLIPAVAVADDNIMNLLLAYSAAHRARILKHSEPSNRIAVWVQDVFPKLRQTFVETPNDTSDNTLAVIIMMTSLEIICSGTFEVPISWQDHLTMARRIISARGGPLRMGHQDQIAYFLSRWFAYLDVLGSLSGGKTDLPLYSSYWSSQNTVAGDEFEIDCLMGFTTRCVGSLARISELAVMCEPQRIDDNGNVRGDWRPDAEIVGRAVQIHRELEEGLLERNNRKGCNHRSSASTESEGVWDATEIYATNEMFHCKQMSMSDLIETKADIVHQS